MPANKPALFLDSNIVLYLLSDNEAKANKVEALLRLKPVISVQVLNEVTNVCIRKLRINCDEIGQFLGLVMNFCKAVPLTLETHQHARKIAERHKLAFYDACIVAAASDAGCQILYTEDMHDGLMLKNADTSLTIKNPFTTG